MKRTILLGSWLLVMGSLLTIGAQTLKNEVILVSDFEDGKIGKWGPRGTEKVEVSTEVAKSGKYSLKISERSKT
ncbi:MAG: carbohydrate binding domain-containing protein, partial [Treponemataceae bacterium]|nr:carbohydrate binding domain-containing protein [Treponemataceae bacterium]